MPVKKPIPPLEQLVTQVKITNSLLAAQLLQHMTQQEIIGLLKGVGASMQDIADILGTSYATVAVSAARLRKKHKGEPSNASNQDADADADAAPAVTAEADLRETRDGPERPE